MSYGFLNNLFGASGMGSQASPGIMQSLFSQTGPQMLGLAHPGVTDAYTSPIGPTSSGDPLDSAITKPTSDSSNPILGLLGQQLLQPSEQKPVLPPVQLPQGGQEMQANNAYGPYMAQGLLGQRRRMY